MGVKIKNNAFGVLLISINTSATSITLQTGQGANFPSLSAGDYFYATLIDTSNNLEIVKVTARTGDVLTVVRAQEGTTARSYAVGDRIELRLTAQNVLDMLADGSLIGAGTIPGTALADLAVSTAKLADGAVTSAKIADLGIATGDLADAAVTAAKLASGAARTNFGAGAVLQVVHVDYTAFQSFTTPSNTNQSQATGLTATITPSSTNSKILAICSMNVGHDGSSSVVRTLLQRTGPSTANSPLTGATNNTAWSTVIYIPTPSVMYPNDSITWLDTPSSTAACTYTLRIGGNTAGSPSYLNGAAGYGSGWGGTSHLTLLEIAG
jgi:hypothetical protein